MGRIAKLLAFTRLTRNGAKVSDVKLDPGGGANITAEHFADAGDDAHPLATDYLVTTPVEGTGREAAVGYVDPLNTPKAQPGDKRIYGRDASTGAVVVEVWLKNDGTAIVSNDNGSVKLRPDGGTVTTTPLSTFDAAADGSIEGVNGSGYFELQAGGTFEVNNVTIDPAGNIITPQTVAAGVSVSAPTIVAATSLTVAGKEMAGHAHSQANDSGGNTEQNTGGPV